MAQLVDEAMAYEPPQTKNIADLEVVRVDADVVEKEYTDKEGKPFKLRVITIDNEDYRVPVSVLKSLKAILEEKPDLSEEESIVRDKEQELFDKCSKSLNATIKLREEVENAFNKLKEEDIQMEDIRKISDLTQEYDVEIKDVIVETFRDDKKTKKVLIETLGKIEDIFNQYEKWKETDFAVF